MDVALIDYGAGNHQSVMQALEYVGYSASVVSQPEEVLRADRLVLPGVGAAGEALERLRSSGLDKALDEAVRIAGRPFLGICLGMQLLAKRLNEFGEHEGLGWIDGDVIGLRDVVGPELPIPHMGWNRINTIDGVAGPFHGLKSGREFYFAHSFTLAAADPNIIAATADYGKQLTAAIQFDNVLAVQFHPEKSQVNGQSLLTSFMEWSP